MALFKTQPSELDWLQVYDTLMKNCFKDWSQSKSNEDKVFGPRTPARQEI